MRQTAVADRPAPTLLGRQMAVLVWMDGKIIGDATVICSPRDPNWFRNHRHDGVIEVRRPVTEIVQEMVRSGRWQR